MTSQHSNTVAILATNGFEQVELTSPREALEAAGIATRIVSDQDDAIQGMHHAEKGDRFPVDQLLGEADASNYDAIVIPGGLFSPDALRTNEQALSFVRDFFDQKKVVSAICHGPQVLISADVVEDRDMTAVPAVQVDLRNAGAIVYDQEMVCDQGLVTSRVPGDLAAFNAKLVEEIEEGRHKAQQQSVA